MKRLALALVFLTAACASTQGSPQSYQTIASLEQTWHASTDAESVAALLSPDFRRPMASGEIWDREQQLEWLRSRPPAPGGFTVRVDPLEVHFYGPTAVAVGIATLIDPSGAIADRNAFTDVYVFRDDAWRLTSAQRTQLTPPVAE